METTLTKWHLPHFHKHKNGEEMNQTSNDPISRSAGILLAISSLPSNYGIGTFGRAAFEFVDFLKKARQKYWQVLPLGPTSYGDSPYQSCSAFAGNSYYIDLDILVEEGLLEKSYVLSLDWGDDDASLKHYVDYEKIFLSRFQVLSKAFKQFEKVITEEQRVDYNDFLEGNNSWLDDYALFMACKVYFNYTEWSNWERDIKFRKPEALETYKEKLAEDIKFWKFCQYQFDKQWKRLKKYANENGIEIIGDIPIYTAYDSADVWSNTRLFQLDVELAPVNVSGVPPDAFTELGQKWGTPIYEWEVMKNEDFIWWRNRIKRNSELYDVIRIDHFIGIVRYYTIPANAPNAKEGEYKEGPGKLLTDVFGNEIGNKKLIAESLGASIPEVDQLLKENNYPSMAVLEFAFDGNIDNPHLPFNYERNSVVYGGTHDNETLQGYFNDRNDNQLGYAYEYLGTHDKNKLVDEVFRVAYGSVANLVVFQVQDLLKLDNLARMNFPSTMGSNWKWRLLENQLTDEHVEYLKKLVKTFARESTS